MKAFRDVFKVVVVLGLLFTAGIKAVADDSYEADAKELLANETFITVAKKYLSQSIAYEKQLIERLFAKKNQSAHFESIKERVEQIKEEKVYDKVPLSELRTIRIALGLNPKEMRDLMRKINHIADNQKFFRAAMFYLMEKGESGSLMSAMALEFLAFKGSFNAFVKKMNVFNEVYQSTAFRSAVSAGKTLFILQFKDPAAALELFVEMHKFISSALELNVMGSMFHAANLFKMTYADLMSTKEKKEMILRQSEDNFTVISSVAKEAIKSTSYRLATAIKKNVSAVLEDMGPLCVNTLVSVDADQNK